MIEWDERTDIVILGSGLAGLSAAIEASLAGASVIVFEKMKVTGGNTRISDGGLAAPNNYLQEKWGIEDSPERFYDDMINAGLGLNHPDLLKVLADKANEAIEWTQSRLGVRYMDRLDRFGGHSAARCLTTRRHSGADLIKAQIAFLKQTGVAIRTRCLLTRLLSDRHGGVCGVQIRSNYQFPDESSGMAMNIRANRAVILATGGFGNDVRFRLHQNPRLDESVASTNHRGATAEGLTAALALKALPVHLSWIQLGPWGCVDEVGYGRGARFAAYCVYPCGIVVDPATGRRIVNEWADRRRRCDAILGAGHPCVGIVDANGAASDAESLRHGLDRGTVKAFEALSDLAAAFEMPTGRLEMTVEAYNQAIDNNRNDAFGKSLSRKAMPLITPPFYANRLWPKVHYTSGGAGINSKAQVLDLNNQPIARLFAAGEVCGGIHGASRLGCCSLTECIVFGRIAGQQAAGTNKEI